MPIDPFASPFARAAALAMLAFSLAAGALLLHLNNRLPVAPTDDRYGDLARQGKLERGMRWLKSSLLPGADAQPVDDACASARGTALQDCLRADLNQRLAGVVPPVHLAAGNVEADALPDLLLTMRWLLRYGGSGARLHALVLRGEHAAVQTMKDPFRLNGCVSVGVASAPCGAGFALDDALLPHSDALLTTLVQYTAATRGQSPNVARLQAAPGLVTPITQGRHVVLALDPDLQELAQTTAACYSGDAAACARCHWCNTAGATDMFEQARARAVGMLVLDTRSGAIEAAASAYTPCFVQQQLGQDIGAGCPQLPNTRQPHRDRLGNQALEQTAKPGSITKIVIALGLQQAGLDAAEVADLPRILTYSRTEDLIDIAMCKRRGFDPACATQRLATIAATASALGWNHRTDVLGAGQLAGLKSLRFSARLLSQGDGAPMVGDGHTVRLSQGALHACSRQHWRGCKGRDLVDLVAELFGTGEALASPLGVGNALLHLAAAANRQDPVAQAHLVASAQNDTGATQTVQALWPAVLRADTSAPVVEGLQRTPTQGTARTACAAAAAALPAALLLPCVAPASADPASLLRIAGKTGTPVFSADRGEVKSLTLPEWNAQCAAVRRDVARVARHGARWFALSNEAGKCNMVPTKWFAFMLGAPGSQRWDKVVVVLTERNWNQRTQRIDSPNDNGPNVAAEAGMALANAIYQPGRVGGARTGSGLSPS